MGAPHCAASARPCKCRYERDGFWFAVESPTRKLCAALQHATGSDRPVLLRREADVGHGARSVSRSVELSVDTMAFTAARTGLDLS